MPSWLHASHTLPIHRRKQLDRAAIEFFYILTFFFFLPRPMRDSKRRRHGTWKNVSSSTPLIMYGTGLMGRKDQARIGGMPAGRSELVRQRLTEHQAQGQCMVVLTDEYLSSQVSIGWKQKSIHCSSFSLFLLFFFIGLQLVHIPPRQFRQCLCPETLRRRGQGDESRRQCGFMHPAGWTAPNAAWHPSIGSSTPPTSPMIISIPNATSRFWFPAE